MSKASKEQIVNPGDYLDYNFVIPPTPKTRARGGKVLSLRKAESVQKAKAKDAYVRSSRADRRNRKLKHAAELGAMIRQFKHERLPNAV
ncbi:hypothetical protein FWG86_01175 [Candidatus Saccharibacteria bacterium]|nr:hypothetical protein [Candidatus Saccharibacteria bacterium]